MNTRLLKIIAAVALGFVLAIAGGWVWGASGRLELQSRLKQTDLRLQIAEARARLLAARVDLYTLNFGAAAQNLESAKVPLEAVIGRYERDGEAGRLTEARVALTAVEEAPSPRQELWWCFMAGVVVLLCSEVWLTRRIVKGR